MNSLLKRDPILKDMEEREEMERRRFFDLVGEKGETTGGLRADGGMALVHLVREWRGRKR